MKTIEPTPEQAGDVLFGSVEHPGHWDAHRAFIDQVGPKRLRGLALWASASGMYALNLLPLLRPERLTIFDENPAELLLFSMMRRMILESETAEDWMRKLAAGDCAVTSPAERVLRKTLSRWARGGRFEGLRGAPPRVSWAPALANFDALKACLEAAAVTALRTSVKDPGFKAMLARQRDTWVYLGNLYQRIRADSFDFWHPENVVLLFASSEKADRRAVLDLRPYAREGQTLRIFCKAVQRTGSPVWYRDDDGAPGRGVRMDLHPMDRFEHLDHDEAAPMYREIAEIIKHSPYRKLLEVGCRHGRVTEFLDERFHFLGFDIAPAAIQRARRYVAERAPGCDFKFKVAGWDDPPDAEAEVILFGGVLYYIEDHLAFLERYIQKYGPKLVIICEPHTTDLSRIEAVYPCAEKRTLSLDVKQGRRTIYTFPIGRRLS